MCIYIHICSWAGTVYIMLPRMGMLQLPKFYWSTTVNWMLRIRYVLCSGVERFGGFNLLLQMTIDRINNFIWQKICESCVCLPVCVCMQLRVCMYESCVCLPVCVCMQLRVCMYVCMYVGLCTHVCIHTSASFKIILS